MRAEVTAQMQALLERGAGERVASGLQAAWCGADGVTAGVQAGAIDAQGGASIEADTLFDIASLTKPFVASAALRLADRGAIGLDRPLAQYLPLPRADRRARASVEQLLAHEAGFVAWEPLFERIDSAARGTDSGGRQLREAALATPPHDEQGAVYSDLGYIVLAGLLEQVTGKPLDELIADEVTGPLQLPSIGFRKARSLSAEASTKEESSRSARRRVAATEECPWRGRVLRGEVHDDNAWAMGGVAGHAGLFATAADVARFGAAWLGALGDGRWLSAGLARRAVQRRASDRGLGWDLIAAQGSSAGTGMGAQTFGHLGFTGCSLWIDPEQQLAVALLTNRVHPTRANERIKAFRPLFHDTLVAALCSSE